jgi:hypothetical protein
MEEFTKLPDGSVQDVRLADGTVSILQVGDIGIISEELAPDAVRVGSGQITAESLRRAFGMISHPRIEAGSITPDCTTADPYGKW